MLKSAGSGTSSFNRGVFLFCARADRQKIIEMQDASERTQRNLFNLDLLKNWLSTRRYRKSSAKSYEDIVHAICIQSHTDRHRPVNPAALYMGLVKQTPHTHTPHPLDRQP